MRVFHVHPNAEYMQTPLKKFRTKKEEKKERGLGESKKRREMVFRGLTLLWDRFKTKVCTLQGYQLTADPLYPRLYMLRDYLNPGGHPE